jgi:zinc transport system substrate-binding protein
MAAGTRLVGQAFGTLVRVVEIAVMRRLWYALAAMVLAAGCHQSPDGAKSPQPSSEAKARLAVVASFYPLYEFARQVAGDLADVTSLVPSGVEPHDWEPAAQDVARLEKAGVFTYNGAGFEPWADRLLANLSGPGPAVVAATDGIDLAPADLPGHGHNGDGANAALVRAAGANAAHRQDPHVWLDPVLAQRQVETIRAALATADPQNAAGYAANARAFLERLRGLAERYERGLARCKRREIVVSHASFTYPARRYRLTQVPVMGLSPGSEPSPAQFAQIVRFARRHAVTAIFFETLVSPKLAETLAREVGARTMVLNPIEGLTPDDQAAGRGYVELMDGNLENLRTALECA